MKGDKPKQSFAESPKRKKKQEFPNLSPFRLRRQQNSIKGKSWNLGGREKEEELSEINLDFGQQHPMNRRKVERGPPHQIIAEKGKTWISQLWGGGKKWARTQEKSAVTTSAKEKGGPGQNKAVRYGVVFGGPREGTLKIQGGRGDGRTKRPMDKYPWVRSPLPGETILRGQQKRNQKPKSLGKRGGSPYGLEKIQMGRTTKQSGKKRFLN